MVRPPEAPREAADAGSAFCRQPVGWAPREQRPITGENPGQIGRRRFSGKRKQLFNR